MEYPKPEPRAKKSRKPPPMTQKRRDLEAEKKECYRRIDASRPPICQGCGCREFEHSHCFPQAYKSYAYVADERFIRRYCRVCHLNWENGYIWKLRDGKSTMDSVASEDYEFFMRKLGKAMDRLSEYKRKNWLQVSNGTIIIPDWADEMIKTHLNNEFDY